LIPDADTAYTLGTECRDWYRELYGFDGKLISDPEHPTWPWDGFTRAVAYAQTEIKPRDLRVMLLCMAAAVADNP
jgi:hypothetical protein